MKFLSVPLLCGLQTFHIPPRFFPRAFISFLSCAAQAQIVFGQDSTEAQRNLVMSPREPRNGSYEDGTESLKETERERKKRQSRTSESPEYFAKEIGRGRGWCRFLQCCEYCAWFTTWRFNSLPYGRHRPFCQDLFIWTKREKRKTNKKKKKKRKENTNKGRKKAKINYKCGNWWQPRRLTRSGMHC
jgi:hypothetical protein